jgi:hypothetical protein
MLAWQKHLEQPAWLPSRRLWRLSWLMVSYSNSLLTGRDNPPALFEILPSPSPSSPSAAAAGLFSVLGAGATGFDSAAGVSVLGSLDILRIYVELNSRIGEPLGPVGLYDLVCGCDVRCAVRKETRKKERSIH